MKTCPCGGELRPLADVDSEQCILCGGVWSARDLAMAAGALLTRTLRPPKRSLADYGWTRVAEQSKKDIEAAAGMYGSDAWWGEYQAVCRDCGKRSNHEQMEQGEYTLLPCGHAFLLCVQPDDYVLLSEPPEEAV
jgi:hypothetical protein